MADYFVYVPYRGVQVYQVKASSAAEAMRKADGGESDDVEPVDYDVSKTYKPSHAIRLKDTTP